jgi:hypothetical protein
VLSAGHKAQLPPVGEVESQAFETKSRSELTQIVDWMKEAGDRGIFIPNGSTDAWMKKAFTSKVFEEDLNRHRYNAGPTPASLRSIAAFAASAMATTSRRHSCRASARCSGHR